MTEKELLDRLVAIKRSVHWNKPTETEKMIDKLIQDRWGKKD